MKATKAFARVGMAATYSKVVQRSGAHRGLDRATNSTEVTKTSFASGRTTLKALDVNCPAKHGQLTPAQLFFA
jgi:hypothetical protein